LEANCPKLSLTVSVKVAGPVSARLVQLKSIIGGGILLIFSAFVLHVPSSIGVIELPQLVLLGVVGFGTSLYFFLIIPVNKSSLTTIDVFQLKILAKC
jgi:hypothetical protein